MSEYCKVCREQITTIFGLVVYPSYKFEDGYYCSRCGRIKKDEAIKKHVFTKPDYEKMFEEQSK